MTTSQTNEPQQQARGPERFAVAPVQREKRSPARAVGAGLALFGLVVGVPLVLWLLTGPPPFPSGVPSRSDLTQPIGIETLLVVFRAVVWLAWLQFVICTVVEAASLLKGGGLPRPVPLSGRSQALARALVGTVLVGGVFLGGTGAANAAAPAPAADAAPSTTQTVAYQQSATQQHQQVAPQQQVAQQQAAPQAMSASMAGLPPSSAMAAQNQSTAPGAVGMPEGQAAPKADAATQQAPRPDVERGSGQHVPGVPTDMTDVIGRKVVIVQPPEGHYHHNLWDIAEESLGDGRRWKEIFELNKGRVQPDGQQLVLGRLIQPGWVLIMPDDAVNAPRVSGDADQGPAVQEQSDQELAGSDFQPFLEASLDGAGDGSEAGPGDSAQGSGRDAGDGTTAHRASTRDERAGDPRPDEMVDATRTTSELARGGLLSAALMLGLMAERRRRRSRLAAAEEVEAEVEIRLGADRARAERLEAALRNLPAACKAEGVAMPQPHSVVVSDAAVSLHLAPAAATAPFPWVAHDDGDRWELSSEAELTRERGPAPYPGLVCLGRDDRGADVLLDIEAFGGALGIDGAGSVAREVVSAWAVQLAIAPWVDTQTVHGHDLEPTLAEIGGSHVKQVADVAALARDWSHADAGAFVGDVSTGQSRSFAEPGRYLLLGSAPDADVMRRLARLVDAPRSGTGIVAAVPVPDARLQIEVDGTGRLRVPLLDIEVEAVRLTSAAAEQVAGLFGKARQASPVHEGDRVSLPRPPREQRDDHFSTATVRVGVLGPLEVRALGPIDDERRALAGEVVSFLALAPEPVHPSVLAASIWPGGVTPDVRDATVERVREWLGQDASGSYRLRENPEGRLHLGEDVVVDWHVFCSLALESRTKNPEAEVDLLRRALKLVRGEFLAERPDQRFSWLARTRLERQVSDAVIDAAHRFATVRRAADPADAGTACRVGLRVAPTSQVLWRGLLRCASHDRTGDGVDAVAAEMRGVLDDAGAMLEPETEALVEELAPGRSEGVGGIWA